MRITRCFIDQELKLNQDLILPEVTGNHLVRVLRYKIGDHFHLFNGNGSDYPSEITSIEKKFVRARINTKLTCDNESPLKIHLFQSIARGDKMDWILQKATELGIHAITPIISDRTEVKLDSERSDKKIMHWLGVIRSACEQSGRAVIPTINMPISLNQIDTVTQNDQAYFLDPRAKLRVKLLNAEICKPLHLAIGPEGGFTERDIHLLQLANFHGITIGPRILRTETAGIAMIAAMQAQFGDW